MKLLLTALVTLTTPSFALACKPAAVEECKADDRVLLRAPTLKKLRAEVDGFQKALSAAIAESDKSGDGSVKRNSCFNNHFASHYIGAAQDYAKRHKQLFCPSYLDTIDEQVKKLINPGSEEWKAANAGDALTKRAKAVQAALDEFQGAHSK